MQIWLVTGAPVIAGVSYEDLVDWSQANIGADPADLTV